MFMGAMVHFAFLRWKMNCSIQQGNHKRVIPCASLTPPPPRFRHIHTLHGDFALFLPWPYKKYQREGVTHSSTEKISFTYAFMPMFTVHIGCQWSRNVIFYYFCEINHLKWQIRHLRTVQSTGVESLFLPSILFTHREGYWLLKHH